MTFGFYPQAGSAAPDRAAKGRSGIEARSLQNRPKRPPPPQTAVRTRADWQTITPQADLSKGLYFQSCWCRNRGRWVEEHAGKSR